MDVPPFQHCGATLRVQPFRAGVTIMSINVVTIDLGKNFFQVCVLDIDGTIALNRKVHRGKLLHTIR